MRKNFEMTQAQLEKLYEAGKPIPLIAIHIGRMESVQERANRTWEELGKEMGFDYMSVKPTGQGDRFFTAEVSQELLGKE